MTPEKEALLHAQRLTPSPFTKAEEVWLRAFLAVTGTTNRTVATSWADYCLEQFNERFAPRDVREGPAPWKSS